MTRGKKLTDEEYFKVSTKQINRLKGMRDEVKSRTACLNMLILYHDALLFLILILRNSFTRSSGSLKSHFEDTAVSNDEQVYVLRYTDSLEWELHVRPFGITNVSGTILGFEKGGMYLYADHIK